MAHAPRSRHPLEHQVLRLVANLGRRGKPPIPLHPSLTPPSGRPRERCSRRLHRQASTTGQRSGGHLEWVSLGRRPGGHLVVSCASRGRGCADRKVRSGRDCPIRPQENPRLFREIVRVRRTLSGAAGAHERRQGGVARDKKLDPPPAGERLFRCHTCNRRFTCPTILGRGRQVAHDVVLPRPSRPSSRS